MGRPRNLRPQLRRDSLGGPLQLRDMTKSNLPAPHNQQDVENARTKGQLVGWIQGGAVGVGGMVLLGYIGWIPTLAVLGIGGFVLYKLLSGSSKPRPPN